jgi:hypothetical protein
MTTATATRLPGVSTTLDALAAEDARRALDRARMGRRQAAARALARRAAATGNATMARRLAAWSPR